MKTKKDSKKPETKQSLRNANWDGFFEDIKARKMPTAIVGEEYCGHDGKTYTCTKYSIERYYNQLLVTIEFDPNDEEREEEGEEDK